MIRKFTALIRLLPPLRSATIVLCIAAVGAGFACLVFFASRSLDLRPLISTGGIFAGIAFLALFLFGLGRFYHAFHKNSFVQAWNVLNTFRSPSHENHWKEIRENLAQGDVTESWKLANKIFESKRDEMRQVRDLVMEGARGILSVMMIASLCGVLAALLAGVGQLVGLMVNLEQVKRLTENNMLLREQNSLTGRELEITLSNQYITEQGVDASRAYDRVVTVLLDRNAGVSEQEWALRTLPEVIVMKVSSKRFDVEHPTDPSQDSVTYPNLALREILRQFLASDRMESVLKASGNTSMPEPGELLKPEFLRAVRQQSRLSTTLLKTLHRLGPPDPLKPGMCIWLHDPFLDRQLPNLAAQSTTTVDLSFLKKSDLEGLQAPGAFWDVPTKPKVVFPKEANLQGAHLEAADLEGAVLEGADLSNSFLMDANLARSNCSKISLEFARAEGAQFEKAILTGAYMASMNASFSKFDEADISGAQMPSGIFMGADFTDARLDRSNMMLGRFEAAVFRNSSLKQCQLNNCHLSGAFIQQCSFNGADLDSSVMIGVSGIDSTFIETSFRCATLSGSSFRKCNFNGAKFAGSILCGTEVQGTVRSSLTREAKEGCWFRANDDPRLVDQESVRVLRHGSIPMDLPDRKTLVISNNRSGVSSPLRGLINAEMQVPEPWFIGCVFLGNMTTKLSGPINDGAKESHVCQMIGKSKRRLRVDEVSLKELEMAVDKDEGLVGDQAQVIKTLLKETTDTGFLTAESVSWNIYAEADKMRQAVREHQDSPSR